MRKGDSNEAVITFGWMELFLMNILILLSSSSISDLNRTDRRLPVQASGALHAPALGTNYAGLVVVLTVH